MRVTCVQLAIADRPKKESIDHVLGLLDQTRGSDLVMLPELWPCGFFAFDRYASDSEPISGPLVQTLRQKARDLGIHLLTGSFVERDGPNLFNTVLLLGESGTGKEVLAGWSTEDLVAFHTALKRGLLEREVSATLQARDETAWGKTWALTKKLDGYDGA